MDWLLFWQIVVQVVIASCALMMIVACAVALVQGATGRTPDGTGDEPPRVRPHVPGGVGVLHRHTADRWADRGVRVMSDTLAGYDEVRSVAHWLDGRFRKRELVLAHELVESSVRATLTKHLGNLDESPPLFVRGSRSSRGDVVANERAAFHRCPCACGSFPDRANQSGPVACGVADHRSTTTTMRSRYIRRSTRRPVSLCCCRPCRRCRRRMSTGRRRAAKWGWTANRGTTCGCLRLSRWG
jgi:hypothetical protein